MKLVIFDIDGTLTDTKKVDDACFIQAFEETFSIDISNCDWAALKNVTDWGITEEIILNEKGRTPTPDEYALMQKSFFRLLKNEHERDARQFKAVNGSSDFLNLLYQEEEKFTLGIATGAWEKSAKIKLRGKNIPLESISFSNCNYAKERDNIIHHCIHEIKKKTP